MTTAELIEKLERAEGPSRELDWEIHLRNGLQGVGMYGDHPRYTASIDAAMTLLPAGFRWALGYNGIDSGHPVGTASVFSPEGAMFKGSGATPAIALCIAALKAKEAYNG